MPYRSLFPSASSIAALSALAFFANATPASAYEYCRRHVTGFMLGCSFDTMEQCYTTESGIGGYCQRDPFRPPANAFASAPKTLYMSTRGHRAKISSKSK
ncbi:DUF3551 domain-containing protein [Bradyrhizobium sp. Ash2021]|uniref:DUF3551 domain-containing protein n=1 Tax=Bradyrhizobium sp. Ash2021 TaxID=2954771 RepID=UPI00281577A4|nr:DUF3551 domain-containing protein [Bradyrhizobium sp. Ash2021]WMT76916.1 DUF3551 domain-containing protein [Bradyrhizobium sp. Ash2021]